MFCSKALRDSKKKQGLSENRDSDKQGSPHDAFRRVTHPLGHNPPNEALRKFASQRATTKGQNRLRGTSAGVSHEGSAGLLRGSAGVRGTFSRGQFLGE